MSEQDGTQATILQRPANDDKVAWNVYWKSLGQLWRWEPEIDAERQKFLDERRKIKPNLLLEIHPFKDIKLNRADVEWLLATHEGGRGPIDWSDESQRERDGLYLFGADLRHENLGGLPLAKTFFRRAFLDGAFLVFAQLANADLIMARLQEAHLGASQLQESNLSGAQLEKAFLMEAQLQGANLSEAQLQGVKLSGVTLAGADHIGPQLADVQWGDTNLAVVDWSQITMLGDEYEAQQKLDRDGKEKYKVDGLVEHKAAVRAYRQLSIVLRNQGLNEDAARFAFRAQCMQRKALWLQGKYGQYLFSGFLNLLSGYGYKPVRCFIAYLLVILAFATAYFIIGHTVWPILSPLGSVVFSMTSFHGRGFFPGGIGLDDPLTVVAAIEAFIGLLIEVTFIATLTQRLFGK